jgi:hypothetical protein
MPPSTSPLRDSNVRQDSQRRLDLSLIKYFGPRNGSGTAAFLAVRAADAVVIL